MVAAPVLQWARAADIEAHVRRKAMTQFGEIILFFQRT
jgi:hypothetical protein